MPLYPSPEVRGFTASGVKRREGKNLTFKDLPRLAGSADEFAENRYVGAIHTDAAGVDWQAERFGEIEINSGVVQF